jgi:hypothetical protein
MLADRFQQRLPPGCREFLRVSDTVEVLKEARIVRRQHHRSGHDRPGPGSTPGLIQACHTSIARAPQAMLVL